MQRHKSKSRALAAVLIVSALILLTTSCETTPKQTTDVEQAYPDIAFPEFPDPDSVVMLEPGTEITLPSGETLAIEYAHVYMPLDYWLLVTDYVIDVRRAERVYRSLGADDGT